MVDDSRNNTDGDIPVLKPERSKKAVSFSPGFKKTVTFSPANTRTVTFSPINSKAVTFSPANKKTVTFSPDVSEKIHRRPRLRHPRLKLTVVDDSQEVIQNLPGLPDTIPQSTDSTARRSPKKESPVIENRKPGRPKTRPELPGLLKKKPENGITRFKQKSAEWKAAEVFKCGVCNKVLSCRGSYERHTRMHQDSKPYKCSYCPKTFVEACKKAVHERVHSGSKPFPCQQCNKSFRTATQRNVHIRSHTKERPYSCEVCGKVFSQPYSVKVHKEKFHNK